MPRDTPGPAGNRLLSSLPREDYERLLPHLRHVTILDRRGLGASARECYRVVKDEYERLLG